MIDLVTLPDNNGKLAIYKGGNIHGLYSYLEISGASNTFNNLGQISNKYSPPYPTNNDTEPPQAVIAYLCIRPNIIFGYCGKIGNKADA